MNTAKKSAPAFVKGRISPSQIKAIHAVKGKLGMDDDTYRDMLDSRFVAKSCKDLTWRQAEELLEALNAGMRSEERGTRKTSNLNPRASNLKFTDFDNRPGFATGAQCRLIAAMWGQVSRAEDGEAQEKALNGFCHRIAGVAGLRMVEADQVQKLIKALGGMGAKKKS